jgi:hypothetical protein
MRNVTLVTLLALTLFAGCSSVPVKDIQVEAQTDPKANISGYKTYAWLGAAAIVYDEQGQWEPPSFDADAEIKYLIDRELRKRGLTENSGAPDLIVAFAAGIDMDALGLRVNPETKIEVVENVPQGGLMVALADSETGFLIWAGVASADIQARPDMETAKARLDYAVTKMFKQLPK